MASGERSPQSLLPPDALFFLHYNNNREAALQVASACRAKGAEATLVQADLANSEGDKALLSQLGVPIDICIHNAGISESALFTTISDQHLHELLNILLQNPLKITRALLPAMLQKRKGKIIVISSIWGLTGASCEVLYSTAKGGLNSFVKALAKEVALSSIQVNGIAPGAIATRMLDDYSADEIKQLTEAIPAGRLGAPEEIAHATAFLCSKKS